MKDDSVLTMESLRKLKEQLNKELIEYPRPIISCDHVFLGAKEFGRRYGLNFCKQCCELIDSLEIEG